jgi:pSer/pThr/pTyr-binding forkhead associated (FHA) protein
MLVRLVSPDGSLVIPLARPLTLIGRNADCDIHLVSSRVSRRHCCLAMDSGRVVVRDLGSTNGTWIDGRRVEEGRLHPGGELGIAHLRFRLALVDPADAREPESTQMGESAVNPSD